MTNKIFLFIVFCSITPLLYADRATDAIRNVEAILNKPSRTDQDKQRAQELIDSLKQNSQQPIRTKARQLEVRLKGGDCMEQMKKIEAIIGKENFEKARRGQTINPLTIQDPLSFGPIQDLQAKAKERDELFKELQVQNLGDAKTKCTVMQAVTSGGGSGDTDFLQQQIAKLVQEKTGLLQELDRAKKTIQEKQNSIDQLGEQNQQALKQVHLETNTIINQQLQELLGTSNAQRFQKIVDNILHKKDHNDVKQVIKAEEFPEDTAVYQFYKKYMNATPNDFGKGTQVSIQYATLQENLRQQKEKLAACERRLAGSSQQESQDIKNLKSEIEKKDSIINDLKHADEILNKILNIAKFDTMLQAMQSEQDRGLGQRLLSYFSANPRLNVADILDINHLSQETKAFKEYKQLERDLDQARSEVQQIATKIAEGEERGKQLETFNAQCSQSLQEEQEKVRDLELKLAAYEGKPAPKLPVGGFGGSVLTGGFKVQDCKALEKKYVRLRVAANALIDGWQKFSTDKQAIFNNVIQPIDQSTPWSEDTKNILKTFHQQAFSNDQSGDKFATLSKTNLLNITQDDLDKSFE